MSATIFSVLLLIALLGFSRTSAELSDVESTTITDSSVFDQNCGNIGYYIYDKTKNDCVVNFPKLMKRVVTPYNGRANEDSLNQKGLAKYIYLDGEKLFRGILISVIFFIACAALCVLSACIYCCHINYSDRKLEREVRALAKQMHKKYPSRRQKPKAADPKAQSCNMVVEGAGVFVV